MKSYTIKQLFEIGIISKKLKQVLVILGCYTSEDMLVLSKDRIKVTYIEKSYNLKDELLKALADISELDTILPEFVEDNAEGFKAWGEILGVVAKAIWSIIEPMADAAWNTFKGLVLAIYEVFKLLLKILLEVGKALVKVVKDPKQAWDDFKSYVGSFFDNMKNKAGSAVSGIKEAFSGIPEWFRTTFTKAWTNVKNVFSKGGKVFTGIKDGILSGLKSVINALIRGINKVVSIPFNGLNHALNKI